MYGQHSSSAVTGNRLIGDLGIKLTNDDFKPAIEGTLHQNSTHPKDFTGTSFQRGRQGMQGSFELIEPKRITNSSYIKKENDSTQQTPQTIHMTTVSAHVEDALKPGCRSVEAIQQAILLQAVKLRDH